MIELSTLTGASKIALGLETAALYSNDDNLARTSTEVGVGC